MPTGRDTELAPLTEMLSTSSVISPDGSRVAYTLIGEHSTLYVVSTQGGRPRQICEWAQPLSWSLDGQSLIVESYEDQTERHLARVDLSTGKRMALPMPENGDFPTLSPDERWEAFADPRQPAIGQVVIVPVRSIPSPRDYQWTVVTDRPMPVEFIAWSPKGQFLYWISNQDGRECLYGRALDPTSKRPIGPVLAVQHLHQRARIPTLYDLAPIINSDQFLLPLVESNSSIWMRQIRAIK